jgi:hypothetical protein
LLYQQSMALLPPNSKMTQELPHCIKQATANAPPWHAAKVHYRTLPTTYKFLFETEIRASKPNFHDCFLDKTSPLCIDLIINILAPEFYI